jgi:SlyX protein
MSDEQPRRIQQLEEALAHQDAVVQDLSDQLIQQWQTIEKIDRRMQELEEKMEEQSLSQDAQQLSERPPPHY